MVTIQQYLDQKYPTREDKEKIETLFLNGASLEAIQGYLDEKCINQEDKEKIETSSVFELHQILKKKKGEFDGESDCLFPIDLSVSFNLKEVEFSDNNLTSLDFLNKLPHPERLELLSINTNNPLFTNFELSRGFPELEFLECQDCNFDLLDLSGLSSLKELHCRKNNLISIDFLNQLPNPEKLEKLIIFSNNIQPTDIEVFSKFVNLKILKIGTMRYALEQEATDVNEGLEYLPLKLSQKTAEEAKR
ncbi:10371_t:CDS:2 [Funneliformis geosporum]|nr:10371_t:CDS:2 [Funneliformis geosporum]